MIGAHYPQRQKQRKENDAGEPDFPDAGTMDYAGSRAIKNGHPKMPVLTN
jgi:hypothetical protein